MRHLASGINRLNIKFRCIRTDLLTYLTVIDPHYLLINFALTTPVKYCRQYYSGGRDCTGLEPSLVSDATSLSSQYTHLSAKPGLFARSDRVRYCDFTKI